MTALHADDRDGELRFVGPLLAMLVAAALIASGPSAAAPVANPRGAAEPIADEPRTSGAHGVEANAAGRVLDGGLLERAAGMDEAAWNREAQRIRSSGRTTGEKAEALAQWAVASGNAERIREVVRELEQLDLPARDKLALQAQLQEQERRLRAGLPVRMPTLSGRATPPHAVPSAAYRGQATLPPLPGSGTSTIAPSASSAPSAPPGATPPQPLAPGPAVIGTEDLGGAWTSDGRRLIRQGPLYVDPQTGRRCLPSGGTCVFQ